jgi:hypothetical protein
MSSIDQWLKGLTGFDKRGNAIVLAIKTRNKHRGNASQIFRYAVKQKYIATNPISEIENSMLRQPKKTTTRSGSLSSPLRKLRNFCEQPLRKLFPS